MLFLIRSHVVVHLLDPVPHALRQGVQPVVVLEGTPVLGDAGELVEEAVARVRVTLSSETQRLCNKATSSVTHRPVEPMHDAPDTLNRLGFSGRRHVSVRSRW